MDTRRMDSKRTMTMNWDELGSLDDDDDDDFFEANNRISTIVPLDFHPHDDSDDDDDDDAFEDPRMSFADWPSRPSNVAGPPPPLPQPMTEDYDVWMAATMSTEERRKRLFQGMGINSSKELVRLRTMAMSKKHPANSVAVGTQHLPPKAEGEEQQSNDVQNTTSNDSTEAYSPDVEAEYLVRSRSDGDIDMYSIETKRRKENLLGDVSKQRLTRTLSTFMPFTSFYKMTSNSSNSCSTNNNDHKEQKEGDKETKPKKAKKARQKQKNNAVTRIGGDQIGAFFLIKDLNTGKEFVVKEFAEDGMWNRLSDIQTGRQLTMEEFEKSVGCSPLVTELMKRENGRRHGASSILKKTGVLSKRFSESTKKGVSFIKKKANSVTGLGGSTLEKEQNTLPPNPVTLDSNPSTSSNPEPPKGGKASVAPTQNTEWVKVRTQGKTYKELTALRFCQEIQAHQGPIWTIKFNYEGQYLASGGEDKVIHIWEVQECEVASLKSPEESGNGTPLHPTCPSPDRSNKPPLSAPDVSALEKKKKGRSGSRRGNTMPDYVQLPETVFTLSDEPVCSFEGHLDVVLDLSWSKTQYLLSSSMDKTVRMWDLETKACLKLFAHNDYVTCIQFNPVNDEYFISGSLDAKVRIWNVPGKRVVDWTDLHEMVTAACYTPDGQGAAVGSHNGNCRMYSISNGKLSQTIQFDVQNKKATTKKITGFEFPADNPNEVLVTSTDSRIRIYDGTEIVQKFRGFRNGNSQNAACLSPDGKYVVYGTSDESNVYVWKREEPKNGKTKTVIDTSSYESFQCKDVSVVIPWPGSIKFEPPTINLNTKKCSKKPPASGTSSPKKEEANVTNKKQLPPLPNNKKNTNNATDKLVNNDKNITNDENLNANNNRKDDKNSSENNNTSNENNVEGEKEPASSEADPSKVSQTQSEASDSTSTSSNQSSTAASASKGAGWGWFDGGGSQGNDTMQARAWGLVIVTAGLGGEIRAYQNFGMPLKVGRQFL